MDVDPAPRPETKARSGGIHKNQGKSIEIDRNGGKTDRTLGK